MATGRKRDVRTLKMIEQYYDLHEQGKTPKEIAEFCEVSYSTVQKYLDEIAEAHGVSREYLLEIPHKDHIMYKDRNYEPLEPVNLDEIKTSGQEIIDAIDGYIEKISEFIKEEMKDDDNL